MDKYLETFRTWNKIAEIYQDKFMNLDLYNETYDLLLELLDLNSSVLEIGCGPGNITKYLLSKNTSLKIKGIDIASNMVELAKINNPLAKFDILDGRKIDRLNEKYDAIICGFCIPYLSQSDSIKLIGDCKNLLNDSGILYLSFVAGDYENSGFITGSSGDRTFFYFHTLEQIERELKSNNFEIINVLNENYKKDTGTEETHTIIISKKRTYNLY